MVRVLISFKQTDNQPIKHYSSKNDTKIDTISVTNHPNNLQNFGYLKKRIAAVKLLFPLSHDLIEITFEESAHISQFLRCFNRFVK